MATSTPFYFTDTPFITVIHIYTKALSRTCLNRYKTLDFEIVVCSTIQQTHYKFGFFGERKARGACGND